MGQCFTTSSNEDNNNTNNATSNVTIKTDTTTATTTTTTKEGQKQSYIDIKKNEEDIHNETEKLFSEMSKKVEEHEKLRKDYSAKSQDAYKSGNGADAKLYSEKAKAEYAIIEEIKINGQNKIFLFRNPPGAESQIDLHGLYVDFAVQKSREYLSKYNGRFKEVTVITGAGNHSKDGPLIKPKLHEIVSEMGFKFEEVNNGSFKVIF